ncbi:cupin domain-containing protein, partial [Fretibacterium fastidiosum]
FDCAVMERAGRVAVTPLDAGWSDVGSWDALHDVLERDDQDNAVVGDVTLRGARNCLVDSRSRLTVLNGVEDLVVVDSPDALFVTRRGASQEVRAVVKELKGRGRREVSQISESSRPWGNYRVLHEDERHRVKRSVVMPGRSVPLQTHRHSTERWIVLRGTARATLDGTESFLCEGMELFIPRNVPHGLENCGCIDLELIVVQDGEYLGPDDA